MDTTKPAGSACRPWEAKEEQEQEPSSGSLRAEHGCSVFAVFRMDERVHCPARACFYADEIRGESVVGGLATSPGEEGERLNEGASVEDPRRPFASYEGTKPKPNVVRWCTFHSYTYITPPTFILRTSL